MESNPLLKAAAIMEKVAAIFDKEEIIAQEKRAALLKSDFLDPIRAAHPEASNSLTEKLANTDPEVLALLKNSASLEVDADMGFGEGSEKIASDGDEDDALLAFCSSGD